MLLHENHALIKMLYQTLFLEHKINEITALKKSL